MQSSLQTIQRYNYAKPSASDAETDAETVDAKSTLHCLQQTLYSTHCYDIKFKVTSLIYIDVKKSDACVR